MSEPTNSHQAVGDVLVWIVGTAFVIWLGYYIVKGIKDKLPDVFGSPHVPLFMLGAFVVVTVIAYAIGANLEVSALWGAGFAAAVLVWAFIAD